MYLIILAGGFGSRLWPLSRKDKPKQFLNIKEDEGSLFQETILRVKEKIPSNKIMVVTNKDQSKEVREQSFKILNEECIVLDEPSSKNTAPAIGLGLFSLYQKDPEAIAVVLPSDHYISPREKFLKLLEKAEKAAKKFGLVTFGIKPDRPETGYGYIKAGGHLGQGIFRVDRFVEKPDLEKAVDYIKKQEFLWNSGMFAFKISEIIEEYEKYLPEISSEFKKIDFNNFSNLEEIYNKIKGTSIDYGIMEKSNRVTVIKADINWSDVGDWNAIYKLLPKDEIGNYKKGQVHTIETEGSLLLAEDKAVGVVGLENIVLVDTKDALLICSKEKLKTLKN